MTLRQGLQWNKKVLPKYEDEASGLEYLKGCPLRCSPENAHGEVSMVADMCEHVCLYFALEILDPWGVDPGRTSWDALYASAREIRIVSESAPVFTRRSRAPERSRQIPPLRVGACRGWESTSLPLPLPPSGPVVSGEGDQTGGASPRRQGGGERSPRSCLCRTDERTVESTRPRHPGTTSHDPAERWRTQRHRKIQNKEAGKEIKMIAPCRSKHLWQRTDVRRLNA